MVNFMAFKKDLTPLRKRGQIDRHTGKGASEQVLPSREALSTLTNDVGARTIQDYAKATPMANPLAETPEY